MPINSLRQIETWSQVLLWAGLIVLGVSALLKRREPRHWGRAQLFQVLGSGLLAFLLLLRVLLFPNDESVLAVERAAFWSATALLIGGAAGILVGFATRTRTGPVSRWMNHCMAWGVWIVALALGFYFLE